MSSNNVGAAYIYTRNGTTWGSPQKLSPSNTSGAYDFGTSVSLNGTRAIVSAPNENNGTIYVFEESGGTWSPTSKTSELSNLTLTEPRSLAVQGTTFFIGESRANVNSGAVRIISNTSGANMKGYAIGLSDEKVEIRLATNTSQKTLEQLEYVVADTAINTSQLNHIAITNTANTQKIYVNGSEVKSGALIQYISSGSGSTNIGFLNITIFYIFFVNIKFIT